MLLSLVFRERLSAPMLLWVFPVLISMGKSSPLGHRNHTMSYRALFQQPFPFICSVSALISRSYWRSCASGIFQTIAGLRKHFIQSFKPFLFIITLPSTPPSFFFFCMRADEEKKGKKKAVNTYVRDVMAALYPSHIRRGIGFSKRAVL